MILKIVTWTHSLIGIGMIKRCCFIHAIRSSIILLLGKQTWKIVITAVIQNNVFPPKIKSSLLDKYLI